MRAIIALVVVFVSMPGYTQGNPGFKWLMEYSAINEVQVRGSQFLGIENLAFLPEVLERVSEEFQIDLEDTVTVDFCRSSSDGVRCSLIFANDSVQYLLEYTLFVEDGEYKMHSPARLYRN